MSVLIEELKKEHLEIVAALNKAKELGILSREGQSKLMSVKAVFLEHLKKEDEQLYPTLINKAEGNKNIKNTLDLFSMDMENVSRIVLEIFDKCSGGEALGMEFQREFENLLVALNKRIMNEEDLLYEEYEEYEKMNE